MMAAIQHQANTDAQKKPSRAQRQDIRSPPLVDPGNPPHSSTSRAKTHSTRRCHRMVALAARSSGCSTGISSQTKIMGGAECLLSTSLASSEVIKSITLACPCFLATLLNRRERIIRSPFLARIQKYVHPFRVTRGKGFSIEGFPRPPRAKGSRGAGWVVRRCHVHIKHNQRRIRSAADPTNPRLSRSQ